MIHPIWLMVLTVFGMGIVWAQDTKFPGYQAKNVVQTSSGLVADLTLVSAGSSNGRDIANLRLTFEYQTDTRLHVLIEDADQEVFQVQEQVLPRPPNAYGSEDTSEIQFAFTDYPFSFNVTRKSTGDVLFDTSSQPLVFETQHVRLRTTLPQNANLYGLGEHADSFRLPLTSYKRTLWNSESPFIPENQNLYGSHPVYFDHRGSSGTHAVFLLSSSGMDIVIDKDSSGDQYLEYNTIGGVLDLYFLAGPEPAAVSKQYAEVVGVPAMMPYWSFGFHQCKYGWNSIDTISEVISNYSAAGIPLEGVWADIDYMDNHKDFTTDPVKFPFKKVRALVDNLHKNNQRFVMILDPGIKNTNPTGSEQYATHTRGISQDVFLKAADGSYYRGNQWPGEVVWPDWFSPKTQDWWTNEIKLFFDPVSGIPVDGLWNDMNEASSMCDDPTTCFGPLPRSISISHGAGSKLGTANRDLFTPPSYTISNHRGPLSGSTLFTNITNHDLSTQYDTHNLYGTMMITATYHALLTLHPNLRPFVLTRSNFPSAGTRAAHWFGDNASTWQHYRAAIRQLLSYPSMHVIPMVGSDVCGFNGVATEHMCARWAAMAAFQPFYRNHADISAPAQEFYRWDSVAATARRVIDARYRLLDYMYTGMWSAAGNEGGRLGLVSPLWFVWPGDESAFGIETQWMLGEGLLVSPVVGDEATEVEVYLPEGVWYDFWDVVDGKTLGDGGKRVVEEGGLTVRLVNVGWDLIPVHIRGGRILPMRSASGMTTAEVRGKNFTIVVAPGKDMMAAGELYLDDGVSLDVGDKFSDIVFTWDGNTKVLEATGTFGYQTDVVVEKVEILGGEDGPVFKTGSWGLGGGFTVQF